MNNLLYNSVICSTTLDEAVDEDANAKLSHPQTAATGRATAVSFDEEAIASKEKKQGKLSELASLTDCFSLLAECFIGLVMLWNYNRLHSSSV